jgi:hypothetical protein
VGRVAEADVVEDGLTEDVPSSMIEHQKLRTCVCGQETRPFMEGGLAVVSAFLATPALPQFSAYFRMKKSQRNNIKTENICSIATRVVFRRQIEER